MEMYIAYFDCAPEIKISKKPKNNQANKLLGHL